MASPCQNPALNLDHSFCLESEFESSILKKLEFLFRMPFALLDFLGGFLVENQFDAERLTLSCKPGKCTGQEFIRIVCVSSSTP